MTVVLPRLNDAVSETTCNGAMVFAAMLSGLEVSIAPHVSSNDAGEVDFYWNHDGGHLDIGFSPEGNRSHYAKLPDGSEFLSDEDQADATLPEAIVAYLSRGPAPETVTRSA